MVFIRIVCQRVNVNQIYRYVTYRFRPNPAPATDPPLKDATRPTPTGDAGNDPPSLDI